MKLWHYTSKGEFPEVTEKYKDEHYPEIPCLVSIYSNQVGIRHFNPTANCWDDEEAGDYDCSAEGYDKWAYIDDIMDME